MNAFIAISFTISANFPAVTYSPNILFIAEKAPLDPPSGSETVDPGPRPRLVLPLLYDSLLPRRAPPLLAVDQNFC